MAYNSCCNWLDLTLLGNKNDECGLCSLGTTVLIAHLLLYLAVPEHYTALRERERESGEP